MSASCSDEYLTKEDVFNVKINFVPSFQQKISLPEMNVPEVEPSTFVLCQGEINV